MNPLLRKEAFVLTFRIGLLQRGWTNVLRSLSVAVGLGSAISSDAWERDGNWGVSGSILDIRSTLQGYHYTNTLSVTGYYAGGRFTLEMLPVSTDDEISESAAWDGEKLRLIQRYPEAPGKKLPRDQALAYVEASIFSRYATHPTLAVMLALADTNSLSHIMAGEEPIILAGARVYPEEQNTYKLLFSPTGGMGLEALCPGREVSGPEERPIPGFETGFLRWKFVLGAPSRPDDGSAEWVVPLEYSRFIPSGSQLFEYRHVQGDLKLHKAGPVAALFKPRITETRLKVLDYSRRKEFYPFTKGRTDSAYGYELSNRAWDFDERIISAWATEVKSGWELKGVRNNVEETRYVAPNYAEKRQIGFWVLLSIFLSLPLILFRIKAKSKGTK